jgi:hypothetical protein
MAGSVADHQRVRRLDSESFQGHAEDLGVGLLDAVLEGEHEAVHEIRQPGVGEGGSQVEVNIADDPDLHARSFERFQRFRDVVGDGVVRRVRFDRLQNIAKIVVETSHAKQPSARLTVHVRRFIDPVPPPLNVWMLPGCRERDVDPGDGIRRAVAACLVQGALDPGRQGHRDGQRSPPVE